MSSRIDECFRKAKANQKAVFVSYICAGDPDFETSLEVCRCLIENGTDILELGVPFSDPLADGLTNQLAAERALQGGINQSKVFQLVEKIREFSEIPIVFYTYYNLVFSHGVERYVERAKAAGVDGLLTLDLPPEEAGELEGACQKTGLQTVYILAPTTPAERIRLINDHTTGFLYYVSQEGVTGERDSLAANLADKVKVIREHSDKPLVVGFGISKPEHVQNVAALADGVVVGSALVNCIPQFMPDKSKVLSELKTKISSLSKAID